MQSDRFRSQVQNAEDCFERLAGAFNQLRLPDMEHSDENKLRWKEINAKMDRKRLADKKRVKQKKEGRRAKGGD